jgi:tetratricopeptide (TPR) repeat protein
MGDRHAAREALAGFLAGQLALAESAEVRRHLVHCEPCQASLLALLPGRPAPPEGAVSGLPASAAVRRLGEGLVAASHRAVSDRPRAALELARLALALAPALADLGGEAVATARLRAYTHLANAWRMLGDFRQAERAFRAAEAAWEGSLRDPLDSGRRLEFEAPMLRAQGRFDEALALIDEAIALYGKLREPHWKGRASIIKGVILRYRGALAAAADCLRDSLFLLDGDREPRLLAMAQMNLIGCLHEAGRPAEAAALLPAARRFHEQVALPADRLRLTWIAGRVASSLGRFREAERDLLAVREDFLAGGLALDAALVCLDLAALYAQQGRTAEMKRLAAEMVPIFSAQEVPQAAAAALILFGQAAQRERVTQALVDELAAALQGAQGEAAFPDGISNL